MNPKLSARILVALSILYGVTIAILGFLAAPALSTVATIGAVVIGGLWAVRGLFLKS